MGSQHIHGPGIPGLCDQPLQNAHPSTAAARCECHSYALAEIRAHIASGGVDASRALPCALVTGNVRAHATNLLPNRAHNMLLDGNFSGWLPPPATL